MQQENQNNAATNVVGIIKFFGLFWKREYVLLGHQYLLGFPEGWTGAGRVSHKHYTFDNSMNFHNQKGVYILYNDDLMPVYAGQAGIGKDGCIGNRLYDHQTGRFKNAWTHFSWFGLRETPKIKLRDHDGIQVKKPNWKDPDFQNGQIKMDMVLASLEAILIEGFVPRFNSRGGNLPGATYVYQFEGEYPES